MTDTYWDTASKSFLLTNNATGVDWNYIYNKGGVIGLNTTFNGKGYVLADDISIISSDASHSIEFNLLRDPIKQMMVMDIGLVIYF